MTTRKDIEIFLGDSHWWTGQWGVWRDRWRLHILVKRMKATSEIWCWRFVILFIEYWWKSWSLFAEFWLDLKRFYLEYIYDFIYFLKFNQNTVGLRFTWTVSWRTWRCCWACRRWRWRRGWSKLLENIMGLFIELIRLPWCLFSANFEQQMTFKNVDMLEIQLTVFTLCVFNETKKLQNKDYFFLAFNLICFSWLLE